jgi:outer membrane protein assembly factor BamD (BamD/ComL family)
VDLANRAFVAGNYEEAGRAYENFLRTGPAQENARRHEALFYLALTFALRPAPATDWQRAVTIFKQLVDEYPDSSFRVQANLILALRSEVDQAAGEVRQRDQRLKQLTTELDRLKKIDADRRKRP